MAGCIRASGLLSDAAHFAGIMDLTRMDSFHSIISPRSQNRDLGHPELVENQAVKALRAMFCRQFGKGRPHPLPGGSQFFGQDAAFGDGGHEVGVAQPAGQCVQM